MSFDQMAQSVEFMKNSRWTNQLEEVKLFYTGFESSKGASVSLEKDIFDREDWKRLPFSHFALDCERPYQSENWGFTIAFFRDEMFRRTWSDGIGFVVTFEWRSPRYVTQPNERCVTYAGIVTTPKGVPPGVAAYHMSEQVSLNEQMELISSSAMEDGHVQFDLRATEFMSLAMSRVAQYFHRFRQPDRAIFEQLPPLPENSLASEKVTRSSHRAKHLVLMLPESCVLDGKRYRVSLTR